PSSGAYQGFQVLAIAWVARSGLRPACSNLHGSSRGVWSNLGPRSPGGPAWGLREALYGSGSGGPASGGPLDGLRPVRLRGAAPRPGVQRHSDYPGRPGGPRPLTFEGDTVKKRNPAPAAQGRPAMLTDPEVRQRVLAAVEAGARWTDAA